MPFLMSKIKCEKDLIAAAQFQGEFLTVVGFTWSHCAIRLNGIAKREEPFNADTEN